MQRVFVLDINKRPLMPCHPARARSLLKKGIAAVWRTHPFTIILKEREGGNTQKVEYKIDPGSKTTGLCLVGHFQKGKRVIFAANLHHRGQKIKDGLTSRSQTRKARRARKTRYRKPRFDNRARKEGWLPPSLMSRADNVAQWTKKLFSSCPISEIQVETVRFDTQKIQTPEISGIEYSRGTLHGFELREYLLEKCQRTCSYCGKKEIPLEIDHIVPKSRGGSNRVSNLTLACRPCNQKKGNLPLEKFLKDRTQVNRIINQAKAPLKDAAAVNATRYAIGNMLKHFGAEVSFWSGGRTKKNRVDQGYPKDHWVDAACVGESGEKVFISSDCNPLNIQAQGRGSRQMCRVDKFGFPRTSAKTKKTIHGFQTGDLVRASVPKGKKKGQYVGRVAIRSNGFFNIKTKKEVIQGISHKYCKLSQRVDGYSYSS